MKKSVILLALLMAACGKDKKPANAPLDRAGPPMDSAAVTSAAQPAQEIKNQGTLEVVKNDLKANADTAKAPYSGSVAFKGELILEGSYRAHYEYPQVKEACFWVDPNNWPKVPRVAGDERIVWFCFTNKDEAIARLGPLGTNARATIVIDDYTTRVERADIWDTARLVKVLSKSKI